MPTEQRRNTGPWAPSLLEKHVTKPLEAGSTPGDLPTVTQP